VTVGGAINERIAAARERVEAEGGRWGRPSRFTDQDRAKIAAMRREGRTIREIAVAIKAPRSSIARVLAQSKSAERVTLEPTTSLLP